MRRRTIKPVGESAFRPLSADARQTSNTQCASSQNLTNYLQSAYLSLLSQKGFRIAQCFVLETTIRLHDTHGRRNARNAFQRLHERTYVFSFPRALWAVRCRAGSWRHSRDKRHRVKDVTLQKPISARQIGRLAYATAGPALVIGAIEATERTRKSHTHDHSGAREIVSGSRYGLAL